MQHTQNPTIGTTLTFQEVLESLDLERLIRVCAARTGFAEEHLREQLFEVIGTMIAKQELFAQAFANEAALWTYLSKATVRMCTKQQQKNKQMTKLEAEHIQDKAPSPEQLVMEQLDTTHLVEWVEQKFIASRTPKRIQKECKQLLKIVLTQPERYIHKRESGEKAGRLVFQHSAIASKLGWPRRQVYERLAFLRELVLQLEGI